jgi:type II secretory pathway component GspD/PulD (secretin)
VLAGTGFVVKKTPDYYLVCSVDPKAASFSLVSETRLVKLNHIKADAAVKLLSTGFSDYVRSNPEDNTVSITARPAVVERIISDLNQFDQPKRHVMLDARVVVMERGDLLNLGIEWGWPQIAAGAFTDSAHHGLERGTQPEWPWGIQIGYTTGKAFTDSLLLTLNLLSQNNDATVIASPQVLAEDGQQAEIKVVTEECFKITSPSAYYVQFQLEKISTGTTLTITPRIGDNNEITLEMTTEVSDVIARGADNLPIVTRRTTKNTVRIEDGGTAAVAGLMDNRTRISKAKAPGLGDIPIFGELFRNTKDERSARQVAVFVTARLISETDKLVSQAVGTTIPIEPVGEEFKIALKEALSHLKATGGRQ